MGETGVLPPPGKEQQMRERIVHAQFRSRLPRNLLTRWPAVVGEARSGRYGRYSSGLRSIVSDLMDLS